jgi:hypothetical protein
MKEINNKEEKPVFHLDEVRAFMIQTASESLEKGKSGNISFKAEEFFC